MCSKIPQTRYLCDLLDVKYDSKIDINGFNDYKLPLFDGDSDGFGSKTGGLRGEIFSIFRHKFFSYRVLVERVRL